MRRLLLFALIPSCVLGQSVGAGAKLGAGVTFGRTGTGGSSPVTGLSFAPVAGHYATSQSVAITNVPSSGITIFYTSNGYPASPASTAYSSAVPVSANTTLNAIAYSAGFVSQQEDRSTSGWKTIFDGVNTLGSITGNCPAKQIGGGVAGVITDCEFDTTALGNTALHLSFTSTASGTGQRQVLWPTHGSACDDCTELTQSFDIMPAENQSLVWAYENDAQNWDATRRLQLTMGLQCLQGTGQNVWEVSGQSGWVKSGVACNLPAAWTHVEAHGHRIIGNNACTDSAAKLLASMDAVQTTLTATDNLNVGMVLTIGTEQMLITAYTPSTSTYTVTRGYNSTTAATHASNATISAPIECIYYDTLSIDGVVTNLNKTFAAHPLPYGWSGGCSNQQQIDTTHAGTVGVYIKNKNITCGYGTQATGSAAYTIP